MSGEELVGIVGVYPHTDALLRGPVRLPGGQRVRFRPFSAVAGGAGAVFARQARGLQGFDFELSELPVVNYLSSREHGVAHTALPVFLTRRFVHNLLVVDRSRVREPKGLEGKRVGLTYYGHSDSTWLRGILAEHHGVDLSTIEWVTDTEEQVGGAELPGNVVHIPRGSVEEMLANGELAARMTTPAAVVATPEGSDIGPLWEVPGVEERDWYLATGIFPILHTLVVKDRVLAAFPSLARELFAACRRARDEALAAAHAAGTLSPEDRRRADQSGFPPVPPDPARSYLPADPSPYGLEANRGTLETLVRMARRLGVIQEAPPLDELFAAVG